jgi:hypothetical protein
MNTRRWLEHLRESFAAVAAGGRVIPLGDNGELYRSLALQIAGIRANPQGYVHARRRAAAAGARARRTH